MKNKKISFDWDNTIVMSYMVESTFPTKEVSLPIYKFQSYNDVLIKKIREYYSRGAELYIVTSRKRSLEEYYPKESVEFKLKELDLSHIFPPTRIYYTEGELKAETLKKLGIDLHFDDNMEEILECKRQEIKVFPSLDVYKDSNIVTKGIITDIHGSILLLKRTDNTKKWDIPGGHIKKIEEERGLNGIADGYEREVAEETGLILPRSRLIHQYTHTWKEKDTDMHILWTEYEAEEPTIDLFVQDFQENLEYVWAKEDDLYKYAENMTEVASIGIQFFLDNVGNPSIMEGKYLPSQSHSWSKMKKRLIGLGKNKDTGGGKGHTRPKMTKSASAPPNVGVLEDQQLKKKELKSKLSKMMKEMSNKSANSTIDNSLKKMLDSLSTPSGQKGGKTLSQKEKDLLQAEVLSGFIMDPKGNPFEQVKIKGSGYGYYYSMSDKKTIRVPRRADYYLISNKADHKGRLRLYSHYKFTTGIVLLVPEDEIERIGWN